MRESKYRGKRVDTGEWAYGSLLELNLGRVYICDGAVYIGSLTPSKYEVDPETVGEFCGLRYDGLDIYEGDILRLYGEEPFCNGPVSFMDYDWVFIGRVSFREGSFVVKSLPHLTYDEPTGELSGSVRITDASSIRIEEIFNGDIDVKKIGEVDPYDTSEQ